METEYLIRVLTRLRPFVREGVIRRTRLERVLGALEVPSDVIRPDVERLLAAFDVFVLTSKTEGLPLVLLEAMATGLPVVATAVGGIPDLIEQGVNGYLVPPGDERELTRRLVWLATHPGAGLRVGEAGRALALERYSLDRMVEGYDSLYERVVAARSQRVIAARTQHAEPERGVARG
jgi:glycosyltransferase involved in cell wall biosynthesis